MNRLTAQEDHITKQQLHVNQNLLITTLVVIEARFLDIHNITVSDQPVIKIRDTSSLPERGIEDKREGQAFIRVQALIEILTAVEIGHNDRKIQIAGKDPAIRITLLVTLPIAVIVIILYGETLRLQHTSANLSQIIGEEDGLQIFRSIANHTLPPIKSYVIDDYFFSHQLQFQNPSLVFVQMIILLKRKAAGILEQHFMRFGLRLIHLGGQLN